VEVAPRGVLGHAAGLRAQALLELAALPYPRLLGTLQLLVTVSTPHSFEGPWYPAFVAAQVVVSQTDMLATIIAVSLLVVDGLETLGVPMRDDDAEAFWHLWRVLAVLKGLHPPGRPDDGTWVPATLAEARAFWQVYRRRYLKGPTAWRGDGERQARERNPGGFALTSAHRRMLAKLLRAESRLVPIGEAQWLPVATSHKVLTALIGQVYGERVVFPIPQTADAPRAFVAQSSRTRPVARALERS